MRSNSASSFRLGQVIALLIAGLTGLGLGNAHAYTGKYRVALLHVTYTDTKATFTTAQLTSAAKEMHDYFNQISYGKLDMEITPVEVKLSHPSTFYFDPCKTTGETRSPCPPTLIEDAAQAAAAGGFSFSGINGISVLSTFCHGGDWTNGPISISRPGVSGTFQRSYDTECTGPAPGPSGVQWGGWSHEIGHQLESISYPSSQLWHPSGYASGYDEMDSCYPCDGSSYSLLGPPVANGNELIFGGWLDTGNVAIVKAPSPGTTVTLTPIESKLSTQANQAIQIPISPGIYYMVDARRRLNADLLQNNGVVPRGIYDEGVHIAEIEETRSPPMKNINACDTTVAGGCISSTSDPRNSTCDPTTRPAYCWPFDLWHVGDTFTDTANAIKIKIDAAVGDGYSVTVTRGVPPGHPNVYIVPWLTPPMNTYETVDIWVDSSCNGYESDVGPSGLLYGRRADKTVIGNGDDPCANHENRIYATVHNAGDAVASNVVVKFQVTFPLGVGVTGSWSDVGQAKIPSLAPGASATVYVPWTPSVTLTPAQIASGHFKFHSCVQVIIPKVAGELVTADNQAQENFDSFEAVQGKMKKFAPIHGQFFVHAPDSARTATTYYLNLRSELPKGWTYSVAGGAQAVTLDPDQTLQVPVDIQVPDGEAVGQTYSLSAQAVTLDQMTNDLVPKWWSAPKTHTFPMLAGGVVLEARTVLPSAITLTATVDKTGVITAKGVLDPNLSAWVAVDFTDHLGVTYTRLAQTDATGQFTCKLQSSERDSDWTLRALWQGDISHTGAVSPVKSVVTLIGDPNKPPKPGTAPCGK
jgi:hypothetical protein